MTNQMKSAWSPSGFGEVEKQQNPQDISSESDPCSPPQRRRGKNMVTHKMWQQIDGNFYKMEYELHGM